MNGCRVCYAAWEKMEEEKRMAAFWGRKPYHQSTFKVKPVCEVCDLCREHCVEHWGLRKHLTMQTMVPGDEFTKRHGPEEGAAS